MFWRYERRIFLRNTIKLWMNVIYFLLFGRFRVELFTAEVEFRVDENLFSVLSKHFFFFFWEGGGGKEVQFLTFSTIFKNRLKDFVITKGGVHLQKLSNKLSVRFIIKKRVNNSFCTVF